MKSFRGTFLVIIFTLTACGGAPGKTNSQPAPSAYIENKGSDTIVNLALAWAEKYQAENPGVSISVTGGGSGTGIAALLNGTVDIANASRQMMPEEIQAAKADGFDPVEFVIARDAIAVIVNPTNPVSQLTIQQISDIYTGNIDNWSQVGGEDRPIVRLSREVNSGTHVYFRDTVIRMGDSHSNAFFAADTLLLPSSEGIISEVRQNPNAIGYDGLGYVPSDLKVIAVAVDAESAYIMPSIASVNNKSYPIARDLYMYTAGEPTGAVKTYLDWIMTPEAQTIVEDLGFVPIAK
jgi:phosphate transport system substrate-binding protein